MGTVSADQYRHQGSRRYSALPAVSPAAVLADHAMQRARGPQRPAILALSPGSAQRFLASADFGTSIRPHPIAVASRLRTWSDRLTWRRVQRRFSPVPRRQQIRAHPTHYPRLPARRGDRTTWKKTSSSTLKTSPSAALPRAKVYTYQLYFNVQFPHFPIDKRKKIMYIMLHITTTCH
jgi:hypothetical protein